MKKNILFEYDTSTREVHKEIRKELDTAFINFAEFGIKVNPDMEMTKEEFVAIFE